MTWREAGRGVRILARGAGLDERAHDPKLAGIVVKTGDELGVPALVDQTECHGDLIFSVGNVGADYRDAVSAIQYSATDPATPVLP